MRGDLLWGGNGKFGDIGFGCAGRLRFDRIAGLLRLDEILATDYDFLTGAGASAGIVVPVAGVAQRFKSARIWFQIAHLWTGGPSVYI